MRFPNVRRTIRLTISRTSVSDGLSGGMRVDHQFELA
jgi:hypothetical protein